ncbi:MAG TPA: hypothetical protein PLV68_08110, partial [Ilumatobacteraceae bacterium]|nr:hypothetical protein [Ilumatobacteraceae bacterium]
EAIALGDQIVASSWWQTHVGARPRLVAARADANSSRYVSARIGSAPGTVRFMHTVPRFVVVHELAHAAVHIASGTADHGHDALWR